MNTPTQQPATPAAAPQSAMQQPKCSRTVYVVLAIFLGSLGIHNFVAGRTAYGVVQVLLGTVGFFLMGLGPIVAWLWAIGECFMVKQDGNGVPFDAHGQQGSPATETRTTSAQAPTTGFPAEQREAA